ncbi:MAG TPA: hypothetical protein VMA53_15995 [Stellaceae bacterium]|nr:hypothetical protein [Stellaceae bacterium]
MISTAEATRDTRARCRGLRVLIALTLLPLAACNAASEWLAGINPDDYAWEAPIGAAPAAGTMDKDLKLCEGGSGSASAAAAQGGLTITRSEASPEVSECMMAKGYQKLYQSRQTLF